MENKATEGGGSKRLLGFSGEPCSVDPKGFHIETYTSHVGWFVIVVTNT
jgi:hypothetical protein